MSILFVVAKTIFIIHFHDIIYAMLLFIEQLVCGLFTVCGPSPSTVCGPSQAYRSCVTASTSVRSRVVR